MSTTPHVIAGRLRGDINLGVWAPGAPLRQEELAARYGTSRIPVREALQLLSAEGLVRIEPNRGAAVTRFDADEIEEIFELRVMVETHLIEKATPGHDAKSIARLARLQSELEQEDEVPGWLAGDRRFHEALYAPAHRPRAVAFALALRSQVERFAIPRIGPNSRRADWGREHRNLIRAVGAHEVRNASRLLRAHLIETKALVLKHLGPPRR